MGDKVSTILISIGTSIVVSLFTFILGLRSGKNQADRAKLQEIYKSIYAHFYSIKDSIEKDLPKKWGDYEVKNMVGHNEYAPLIQKLKESGELLYIRPNIANASFQLEKDCLVYGQKILNSISVIHEVLTYDRKLFVDEGRYTDSNTYSSGKFHFVTSNNTCNRVRTCDYRYFYNREKLYNLFKAQEEANDFILEFRIQTLSVTYSFGVYPSSLAVTYDEFLNGIYSKLNEKIPNFQQSEKEKAELKLRLSKLLKKVGYLSREPHSFWRTIIGAFLDIFR